MSPPARPRRRFGQNFLRDQAVIDRLVGVIAPRPDDHLVEIGPGHGALTRPLLAACGQLHAIEIDRDLAAELRRDLAALTNFNLIEMDALQLELAQLGEADLRVVGNLPYNISTPLLFRVIAQSNRVRDMHFMLQREVVRRICAAPGSKSYGRLSVSVQLRCEAVPLFDVAPEAFYPPPKVTSQIVRLIPLKQDLLGSTSPELVDTVVKGAFSQRRKTLRNSLKSWLSPEQLTQCGVDPSSRPETLTPSEFVKLAKLAAN